MVQTKELFKKKELADLTFSEILAMVGPDEGVALLRPQITGGRIEGAEIISSVSGARLRILPEDDLNIGLQLIDDAGTDVLKALVGGTDVGDVSLGDYASDQGVLYDKSAGKFYFKGDVVVGDIGGWTITTGYLYGLASGTPTASPSDGIVLKSGATGGVIVYENTEKRVEMGYLSAGVYGLKVYDDDGSTVIFEASDTQMIFDGTYLGAASVASAAVKPSLRGSSHDLVFSASDADTVAWASGTITLSDATSYSIDAGDTGDMSARTYIYLDVDTSATVLQTSTTFSDAVGDGKVLIASAENGTGEATFYVVGGIGGVNIDADSMIVANLAAINADLGTITAGNITLDSSGYIKGGQTAYNTGAGFFLGYSTAAYKFSIGDATVINSLTWDGSDLLVKGTKLLFQDIYGDGSDGTVDINSGTFTSAPITSNALTRDAFFDDLTLSGGNLDTAGYRLFVKGTLTIDNGYKIFRDGNDGGNGGNASGKTGGTAGAAAAALSSGSVFGSVAGKVGTVGAEGIDSNNPGAGSDAGGAGNAANHSITGAGAAGAKGGAGGTADSGTVAGGSGGTVGAAGAITTYYNKIRNVMSAYLLYDSLPTADNLRTASGGGGSTGGGSGGNDNVYAGSESGGGGGGAGSGSGGGIVSIFARILVNSGDINAIGGVGGDGGDGAAGSTPGYPACTNGESAGGGGGGAGGSGGRGGVIILVYNAKSGAGSTAVTGGAAGTGGTGGAGSTCAGGAAGANGTNGVAGSAGDLIELEV